MKKIAFDTGVQEVVLGAGVLRFHPQDPNLYARFEQAGQKLQAVEKELAEKADKAEGSQVVLLLQEADQKMKEILGWVFGAGNDFDAILGGVNLLAVAGNGQRVVTNLFAALEPLLVEGAMACAQLRAEEAEAAAQRRRAGQ